MMKEKANVQSAAPRKVKGTVLFTVVCVMMVLIVFLMGTLALAATANNRAYSNYQRAQTEATARAVLDAAAQSIAEDVDADGIRKAAFKQTGQTILVNLGDSSENYPVEVADTGRTRSFYDATDGWTTLRVYQLTVTIDKTKADTTYSTFLTFKGEFSDEEDDDDDDDDNSDVGYLAGAGSSVVGVGGFLSGPTYMGLESPQPVYKLAEHDTIVEMPIYINSNLDGGDVLTAVHVTAPGDYMYVNGNFKASERFGFDYTDAQVPASFDYKKTPYVYVEGEADFSATKKDYLSIGWSNCPMNLYCGTLKMPSSACVYGDIYTFGTGDSYIGGSNSEAYGKLYHWTASTVTNAPTGSNVYGTWYSKGNITINSPDNYSTVQGDLRSEKDITINASNNGSPTEISGDVICNGTLTINGKVKVAGAVYASAIKVNGNLDCANQNQVSVTGTKIGSTSSYYTNVTINPSNDHWSGWYSWSYDKWTDGATTPEHSEGTVYGVSTGVDQSFAEWAESAACTDEFYNKLKEYRNHGASNPLVEDIYSYDISSALPAGKGPIYPADYASDKLKTTLNQKTPTMSDFASYETDSTDASGSYYKGNYTPITGTGGLTKKTDGGNSYYEINSSCYLKGINFDANVYINPPSGTDIVVFMENCSMSDRAIIANDSTSTPTLYIIDKLTLNTSGAIMTENYWRMLSGGTLDSTTGQYTGGASLGKPWDKAAPVTLSSEFHLDAYQSTKTSPLFPNFVIHSDDGAKLDLPDGMTFVTALVRAPQMDFKASKPMNGKVGIEYKNTRGSTFYYGTSNSKNQYKAASSLMSGGKLGDVSMIGQLCAKNIETSGTDNFGLLYVTIPPTPPSGGDEGEGSHGGENDPFAGESTILFYDYY